MNKVFNINLGGYAFTIDEDAYHHLKQYLEAIDNHFKNSEGFEDITTDIEIRMAEIFQTKLKGRQIVNIKDVGEAINIMGTPEDFGATSNYTGVPEEEATSMGEGENNKSESKTNKDWSNHKFGKRLYRNPDESIVGGVASGISAYLGIEDPVWIRIFLAILIVFGGVSFVFYIILWAVLPEAKTAKQKLEMRGERIDVNNIAKTFENELKNVTDKINEYGGMNSSKKNKKKSGEDESDEVSYGSNHSINEGIAFVRQTSSALEQLVRNIAKPLIFLIGIALMIAVGALWIALIVGTVFGHPYLAFIFPTGQAPLLGTLLFLAISIPIVSIALSIIRGFFKVKIWKAIPIALTIIFIGTISSFFYLASYTGRDFGERSSVKEVIKYEDFTGNELALSANNLQLDGSRIHFGATKIIDDELRFRAVTMSFDKSNSEYFEIEFKREANGETNKKAKARAKKIQYTPQTTISEDGKTFELKLDDFLKLTQTDKWRGQHVHMTLRIPEGKSVKINPSMGDIIHSVNIPTKQGHFHGYQLTNAMITAEADGLVCSGYSGQPHGSRHETEYKDFSEVNLNGNLKVYIDNSDNYEVRLEGGDHHHGNDMIFQTETLLTINGPSYDDRPMKVYIKAPHVDKLTANDVGDIWLKNLDQANLEIIINGETEVHGNGVQIQHIKATLSEDSELTLKGSGSTLEATIMADAKLDADRFTVQNATIYGQEDAYIKLNVLDTLSGKIEEDVDLKIEGQPKVSIIEKEEE